jgi:hypothetical protein
MLNPSARALLFDRGNAPVARITEVAPKVARFPDQRTIRNSLLDRYIEGWAEANSAKVAAATAPGYCFCDPLVGNFLPRTLHEYFDLLGDRLFRAGVPGRPDIAFVLCGPMDRPSHSGKLQFWREAPRMGLTGISEIEVGHRGVIAERVAYDLNLASDALRRAFEDRWSSRP